MPMPQTPKVSIVIPVYNAGSGLSRALDSALGQSLHEIEVIAVDDGSTDGSRELLRKRAEQDSRLRVILQEQNQGALLSRRRGISNARGEYVLTMDPDDFFDPEAAAELSALADREKTDVIHFGTREFTCGADGSLKPRYNWTPPEEKRISGKGAVLRHLLVSGGIWSLCFKMIRTEICRKALADEESFYCIMGEDLYFYLLAAYHAESYLQISRAYYNYDTTAGVTASKPVSPEKFKRSAATILEVLNHGETFLRGKGILEDPEQAAGWEKIVRNQYLVLWNRWYSRLAPGERGEMGEYLLHHAGNKELFLLSVFDENDYLRENEEFLKIACRIYQLLNYIFPRNSYVRMKLKTWYKRRKAAREAET